MQACTGTILVKCERGNKTLESFNTLLDVSSFWFTWRLQCNSYVESRLLLCGVWNRSFRLRFVLFIGVFSFLLWWSYQQSFAFLSVSYNTFFGFCESVLCLLVWQSQWFVLSVYEVSFSSSFFFFSHSSTELTCRQGLTQQHAQSTELTRTHSMPTALSWQGHSRMPTALSWQGHSSIPTERLS